VDTGNFIKCDVRVATQAVDVPGTPYTLCGSAAPSPLASIVAVPPVTDNTLMTLAVDWRAAYHRIDSINSRGL